MPLVDPFERHVAARLLDFFGSNTPWQRRLWGSGISLTLQEVLEASYGVRSGVLSADTLGDLTNYAATLAGLDPGIGTAENKRTVQQALKRTMLPDGVDFSIVKRTIGDLDRNYLERWKFVVSGSERPRPERTARAIASHLLDSGFSPVYLHKWCTFQLRNEKGAKSLPELIQNAQQLFARNPRKFKVLVGFHSVPPGKSGLPENSLSADSASNWLRANGVDVSGIRLNGALLFHVSARDVWAALEAIVENVEHLISRVGLGTDGRLRPTEQAWVEGENKTYSFRPAHRQVEVHALHREDRLYSPGTSNIVDAALELLGALNSGPASSAIGAGWAAIEAVLSGPGEPDIVAADRMAALVACSYARAELTDLSYVIEPCIELSDRLAGCRTNRDRAALVAAAIASGAELSFGDDSDMAACERMTDLLRDAFAVLRDVQAHAAAAFKRLYRNRNLVLHGGHTDSVGLVSSLRTAGPLVGAGMDRIAHAWFVESVRPMELAARAQMGLNTVGSKGGPLPVDLLM